MRDTSEDVSRCFFFTSSAGRRVLYWRWGSDKNIRDSKTYTSRSIFVTRGNNWLFAPWSVQQRERCSSGDHPSSNRSSSSWITQCIARWHCSSTPIMNGSRVTLSPGRPLKLKLKKRGSKKRGASWRLFNQQRATHVVRTYTTPLWK